MANTERTVNRRHASIWSRSFAVVILSALGVATGAATADDSEVKAALNKVDADVETDDDGRVVYVCFNGALTAENLNLVKDVKTLKHLSTYLSFDEVDAKELAIVESMQALEKLTFDSCEFKDDGLASLQKLPKLTQIHCYDCSLGDRQAQHLGKLPKLTLLKLDGNRFTDKGVEALAGLKNLTSLSLEKTFDDLDFSSARITDAAMPHVAKLDLLKFLSLERCDITDAGLTHLGNLKSLTELNLAKTKVTDAGLSQLGNLKSLTVLKLEETMVTDDGIERLRKTLPKCRIMK